MKPLRFRIEGFNRICFQASKKDTITHYLDPCKVLGYEIPFDKAEYDALDPTDRNEYFCKYMAYCIELCAKDYDIPKTELLTAIQEFHDLGYENKWSHKRRTFRELGLKGELHCELTSEAFFCF